MNLLLLISALLSAFTGGASAVRTPAAAHAVACAATAVQAEVCATRIASRPQQAPASLAVAALAPLFTAQPLSSAEPLYASRRRE